MIHDHNLQDLIFKNKMRLQIFTSGCCICGISNKEQWRPNIHMSYACFRYQSHS